MSASPTADEVFGEAAENSRLRDGLAIRRAVLGDEYVDAALASVDEFNRDHQALVTEYCSGRDLGVGPDLRGKLGAWSTLPS